MQYNNVIIKGVSTYHPDNQVTNEDIINHFQQQDIKIKGLLNHLGRNIRYKTNNDENSLTMGTIVAKQVLEEANIESTEIGLVYFVSDTPESLVPTNSLILHHLLRTKNAHVTKDLNANCIGMLTALDDAQSFMKYKNIKYGLIIGSVNLSNIARSDDTVAYGTFGDGACAVILENIKSDKQFGFINSHYYTNSSLNDKIRYPICGLSKVIDNNIKSNNKKLRFIPHDVSFFSEQWKQLILNMLNDNNININDINHFLFSQFSKAEIQETLDKLNVSFDKTTYVGDKYGYTGCTSPIFAYKEALNDNKIISNKYIVLCSVGAGYNMCSLLYKKVEV
jgi:3-oxoacyl-[acyl-carrier-protein] synthase-3